MSILYKNARNVRFVLFRKNSVGLQFDFTAVTVNLVHYKNADSSTICDNHISLKIAIFPIKKFKILHDSNSSFQSFN